MKKSLHFQTLSTSIFNCLQIVMVIYIIFIVKIPLFKIRIHTNLNPYFSLWNDIFAIQN